MTDSGCGTPRIPCCTCDEACPIHGEENMQLIVERLSFYGKERYSPLNATAKLFAALLGQVLLTADDITRIKALGYRVETKGKVL